MTAVAPVSELESSTIRKLFLRLLPFLFLLYGADAGFSPGMILYMTRWFPATSGARAVAWFMTANPRAGVVGSPISGALLNLHGLGLQGWHCLLVMEAVPAVALGIAVYW